MRTPQCQLPQNALLCVCVRTNVAVPLCASETRRIKDTGKDEGWRLILFFCSPSSSHVPSCHFFNCPPLYLFSLFLAAPPHSLPPCRLPPSPFTSQI